MHTWKRILNGRSRSDQSVYRLTSNHTGYHMSCAHREHAYQVGFLSRRTAQLVRNKTSETALVTLLSRPDERGIARMRISKRININKLPCRITSVPMCDFLGIPYTDNIGIVFAFDPVQDFTDGMVMDVQLFEPATTVDAFRRTHLRE